MSYKARTNKKPITKSSQAIPLINSKRSVSPKIDKNSNPKILYAENHKQRILNFCLKSTINMYDLFTKF